MKAEELRQLDAEELSGRLKGARRELYELRFKMAVGQLDSPHQIGRARKEIARILTVVHERQLDSVVELAYGSAEPVVEERAPEASTVETPERVDGAPETDVPPGPGQAQKDKESSDDD
jgi:large subunit ribosomal protein L29